MTEAEQLQRIKAELEKILAAKRTARNLDEESLRAYEAQYKAFQKTNEGVEVLKKQLQNIKKEIAENERAIYGISGAFSAAVDELNGMNAGLNRAKKAFRGLESIADKLANDQADIARMSLKDLKVVKEKVNARAKELDKAEKSLKLSIQELEVKKKNGSLSPAELKNLDKQKLALQAVNAELNSQGGLRKDLITQAQKRIEAEQQIISTLGAAPAILEGVGKALQKIGLPDFGIAEAVQNTKNIIRLKNEEFEINYKIAQEELKNLKTERKKLIARKASKKELEANQKLIDEAAKVENKRVSSIGALSDLMGEVGKKIKDQINPANLIQGAFTLLVAAAIKVDKLTGELAKNIGISYDESLAMQKNFTQIAISSDEIMVSTAELNKGFMSLNQQFKGATGFSNELLQSFTALTTQAGFTEETIGNIAKITGTQGDELNSNVALMQGQLTVMNAQEGTSFSTKQLLEGIGKVSKATLLTLRNQPKALARTLMTSAKLVLSFQEMESIASSLLDFEGSIGAELEAELLTGKQINLESARLLALKGDIAGAAAEVAKEVGSAAEFEKMNVIQQEALAKAAGLTREHLANSLMEREALAKLGGQDKTALEAYNRLKKKGLSDEAIATKLGDERLTAQLKSQSIQERFAASVERLQEIFVDVAQAIMPIASFIADMVVSVSKFVAKFSPILKPLAIMYGLFKGIQFTVIGIGKGMEFVTKFNKKNLLVKYKELKTTLGIDKIKKSIATMQQKGYVKAKLSHALAKLGLLTDKQAVFFKSRMTYFANQKLKKDMMSANFEKASLIQSIKITAQKRLQSFFGKEGYLAQLKTNIAQKANNVLKAIGNAFSKQGFFYKTAILTKDLAINAAKGIYNELSALGLGFNKQNLFYRGAILAKDLAVNAAQAIGNGLLSTKVFLQKMLNREKITEGLISLKNFAKSAAEVLLSVGRLALNAALAVASIPVVGPILAVAAAAAAVGTGIALYNKYKKPAGDMYSPANGKTQVSTKEGGLFELSPNDDFIAKPGIANSIRGNKKERINQRIQERRENNENNRLEKSMDKTNKILEKVAANLKPKPQLGSENGQVIHNGSYNVN
jgi:hypothetical protein